MGWHNQLGRRLTASLCVIGALGMAAGCGLFRRAPRLQTIVAGGTGPPTIVLLHGYGSSPEKWAPFTQTIWLPPGGRFVFPRGPEATVPPDGPPDGRAWWRLDLSAHIDPGHTVPDLSRTSPTGIRSSAALVRELLEDLESRKEPAVVLGGFSQGAMVASELAFMSDVRLRALVLLSGTVVDELAWTARLPRRRGLPVFVAHGRSDKVLPFDVAERFRKKLEEAGLAVTWCPFDGGHEIPAEVVVALNAFLHGLFAADTVGSAGGR